MSKSQRIFLVGVSLLLVFFILLGCAPNTQGGFTCILVPAINKIRSYLPSSSNQTQPKTSAGTQPAAQPPVIIVFNSSPAEIDAGDESVIEWEVSGTATVTIVPEVGSVDRVGTARVSPTKDTVYTLTAFNSAGRVARTVSVTVSAAAPPPWQVPPPSKPQPPAPAPQPPMQIPQLPSPSLQKPLISLFTASPATITAGSCSTMNWLVSGATSGSISPGVGVVPASGSAQACPGSTTTYTMNASNSAGSVQRTVTIYVSAPAPPPPATPPVINSFIAGPASVTAGSCSTLSWTTTDATSATVTPGIGAQPVNGSAPACPAGTTTYTLTATNAAGSVTSPVTVTITGAPPPPATPPVINSFTANPASVAAGSCSTLSWTTTDATSATVTPGVGAQPVNGSAPACPAATTTYTLTATNANGSVPQTVTVTVTATPPPPADDATCEQSLFDAVNALRAADGKAALTRNAYIDGLCRQHAQYMANLNVLSHDNVNSRFTAIYANVPGIHAVAENVLQNNMPCNASDMANQWFNSPLHKTNMLNAAYNISGMGIVIDTNGKIWACQLFAGP